MVLCRREKYGNRIGNVNGNSSRFKFMGGYIVLDFSQATYLASTTETVLWNSYLPIQNAETNGQSPTPNWL